MGSIPTLGSSACEVAQIGFSRYNWPMNQEPSWGEVAKNLLFIAITIGVAYLVTVRLGLGGLRQTALAAGLYAPLVILVLKITTIVVAPLGGTIIYPVAGALFGFWPGLALCLAGDTIGSSIAFFISRYFGRSVLRYFTSVTQAPLIDKVIARLGDEKKLLRTRIYFISFMDLFAVWQHIKWGLCSSNLPHLWISSRFLSRI